MKQLIILVALMAVCTTVQAQTIGLPQPPSQYQTYMSDSRFIAVWAQKAASEAAFSEAIAALRGKMLFNKEIWDSRVASAAMAIEKERIKARKAAEAKKKAAEKAKAEKAAKEKADAGKPNVEKPGAPKKK